MTNTCIIIPIYNIVPTDSEIISITRNVSLLCDYDIFAIYPKSMDINAYKDFGINKFIAFDGKYFKSNKTYSRLLLSREFYVPFRNYDYMLIAQTDTYILNTEYSLDYFVNMGYDYYGAPWPNGPFDEPYGLRELYKSIFVHNPRKLHVGNGGFSLRNVTSCEKAINRHSILINCFWRFNEDLFFSTRLKNIAPESVAEKFALEVNMQEKINSGFYPFALHAYEKHLDCSVFDVKPYNLH